MDSFNILAPYECDLYNDYFSARGGRSGIGLRLEEMLQIDGSSAGIAGCPSFGVNKQLKAYKDIYDEGKGIFLANVGHVSSNTVRFCD